MECELSGDASVSVNAKTRARATAEIWATSYFDAFASADNCQKCDAYADSYGYITKYVFLEAIAEAEIKVCCMQYTCFIWMVFLSIA